MTDWTRHIGQPVCWNHWHGILQDVFASQATGKVLVQIYFVKNAYKRQGAEIIPAIEVLRLSTWEEIEADIEHFERYLKNALAHHILAEASE